MVSVKIGPYQVEVETARRVTVLYGDQTMPRYLTVVGRDGEAWSLADDGSELGTRPKGVKVLGKGKGRPVKLA